MALADKDLGRGTLVSVKSRAGCAGSWWNTGTNNLVRTFNYVPGAVPASCTCDDGDDGLGRENSQRIE